MSHTVPASRPKASRATVIAAAAAAWAVAHPGKPLPGRFVLACRAYYRETMGAPGRNAATEVLKDIRSPAKVMGDAYAVL